MKIKSEKVSSENQTQSKNAKCDTLPLVADTFFILNSKTTVHLCYLLFVIFKTISLAVQNSSIGDLITQSLQCTESLTKGTSTFEIQRAIIETFDQTDFWIFLEFWKIFRILENNQIF